MRYLRTTAALLIAAASLVLSAYPSRAAEPFSASIGARELSAAETKIGFTDEIPPSGIRQRCKAREADGGLLVEINGVELSAWQTASIPEETRYLLAWKFAYTGRIVEGWGRAGFIFGSEDRSTLVSVELTHFGELRVVDWGEVAGSPLGRIKFAAQAAPSGVRDVRIDAEYDMERETLTCSVNGGRAIEIRLRSHGIIAPLTIRDAGCFAAVPEAMRGAPFIMRSPEHDIDLSSRYAVVLHEGLAIEAAKRQK